MDNETSNMTDHCSDPLPYSDKYFQDISTVELVFVIASAVLTVVVCLIFFESVWYLNKYYHSWHTKVFSVWQIGLHPAISLTSMLTVVVPRSSVINSLISSVYVSISLHIFMRLIIHYHGGEKNMVRTMSGEKIPLRSPPLACCICCCPKITLTRSNLKRIKYLVHQVVFLRPILKFLGAVMWTDGRYTKGKIDVFDSFIYITVLNVVSSLVAVYGLVLLYRASKKHLKKFHIMAKYINLKVVMVVTSLQQLVFTILSHYNVPACTGYNTAMARGNSFNNMLLIGEMFVLTLLARYYYRKPEEPITLAEIESYDASTESITDRHVQTVSQISSISNNSKDAIPQSNGFACTNPATKMDEQVES
ncbi:organic solute transporter subunit alpha-like [Gigantopelta aegis]|uniref:organic solute transporter subunit alpha-like n=1 Tax=Gigantopelta aegis TaxID=1735272 RepID=UPI001B88CA6A|nr:organic solute transporter subunit alpha-like [Gigantopelta aegis]